MFKTDIMFLMNFVHNHRMVLQRLGYIMIFFNVVFLKHIFFTHCIPIFNNLLLLGNTLLNLFFINISLVTLGFFVYKKLIITKTINCTTKPNLKDYSENNDLDEDVEDNLENELENYPEDDLENDLENYPEDDLDKDIKNDTEGNYSDYLNRLQNNPLFEHFIKKINMEFNNMDKNDKDTSFIEDLDK